MLEKYLIDLIEGRRKGILPEFIKMFTYAVSKGYQAGSSIRNLAYDKGLKYVQKANLPVVSIGNIVAGGVGKTPLVLKLARELLTFGTPAIVLRGYRSPAEKSKTPIVQSEGRGPKFLPSIVGDEAYLLSKNLPEAVVCVGSDKIHGTQMASEMGAKWVLLDDGFQHRKLGRDIEIIVISSNDPFGKKHFLPRGYLRDNLKSLKRANLIVALQNGADLELSAENEALLRKYTAAPLVYMKQEITGFESFQRSDLKIDLKEKRIGIFCGVANPSRFYHSISQLGAKIVESFYLSDHLTFDEKAKLKFLDSCRTKGAEMLICTEKDGVKLDSLDGFDLPLVWTKTTLNIVSGHSAWDKVLTCLTQNGS